MSAFFDSGVLAKIYFPEANSKEAEALIRRYAPPLPFTALQELEIRNAARLKLFRGEISAGTLKESLSGIDEDLVSGFLFKPFCEWSSVCRQAERLSHRHVTSTGCRTLDVLHVAQCIELGVKEFVSFDRRQRQLSKAAGLKIRPARM